MTTIDAIALLWLVSYLALIVYVRNRIKQALIAYMLDRGQQYAAKNWSK